MRRCALVLAVALLGLGISLAGPRRARAAEITDVASAFDDDNPFDLRFRVGYSHLEKRASIKRELEQSGFDAIHMAKDMVFSERRDTMNLRLEVGIFHDLMVYGELPIIMFDGRDMRFDQSLGSGCVYPGMGTLQPTCVNQDNSTTLRDGIVPIGTDMSGRIATWGVDGQSAMPLPNGAFGTGSTLVFRSADRGAAASSSLAGDAFDTINIGATWAALSQRRDDTKPTWIINFEGRASVGNVMKFDRRLPNGNHAVSDGLHWIIARTAVSKRFRYFDPYVGFWYAYPIARDDSLYINYGNTQKNKEPQQMAGTVFGLELIPWEKPDSQYKIAISAQLRIEGKFKGRGYSEIWDMLASSDALQCRTTVQSDIDNNKACSPTREMPPTSDGGANVNPYQNQPYTGLTTIDNYLMLGADVGVTVQAGKYVRFHAGFQYTNDQGHFVTVDDVGKAYDPTKGNGCDSPIGGRVSRVCEYNPAYRPTINLIGRRYKVDDINNYNVNVWAQVMF